MLSTIQDRDVVEPTIMKNNSTRFNLTQTTLLISTHMSTKLRYLAETDFAKVPIEGKYTTDPTTDPHTNNLIQFGSMHSQRYVHNRHTRDYRELH